MRFMVCAALLLAFPGALSGCSSSSSADLPSTISVQLTNQSSVDNLTPLSPSAVLYGYARDAWVTDYTAPGTRLLMDEMSLLTPVDGGPGLVWNGRTFLIDTNALDPINTSTAEIWITDGTLGGTTLLETLNPTSQMFELLGASLESDALVVAYKINQPGVPSIYATYIERIAL